MKRRTVRDPLAGLDPKYRVKAVGALLKAPSFRARHKGGPCDSRG